jgi:hypothetical protein
MLMCATASVAGIPSHAEFSVCDPRAAWISVNGADGALVLNLTAANFHATFAGKNLPIFSVTPAAPLHRMVLVIHMSERMKRPSTIRTVLTLAADIVNRVPAGVEFALVTFNDDPHWDHPFTTDKDAFVATLHRLDDANLWRGSSAVFDAIEFSIEKLSQPRGGDVILLISCGYDNASKSYLEAATEDASLSKIRIFTVGIPLQELVGANDKQLLREGQQGLDDLAASSGGESFDLGPPDFLKERRGIHMAFPVEKNLGNISAIADSILREMTTGYSLGISMPPQVKKPIEWKLEVTNTEGEKQQIRYPAKLYPCYSGAKHK